LSHDHNKIPSAGFLLFGFAVSQFLFYSIVPHLLRLSSAVVFNLSLLTADIYTLFFGLFLFHYKVSTSPRVLGRV
jgi:solute carrier family 35 protein F1/2